MLLAYHVSGGYVRSESKSDPGRFSPVADSPKRQNTGLELFAILLSTYLIYTCNHIGLNVRVRTGKTIF